MKSLSMSSNVILAAYLSVTLLTQLNSLQSSKFVSSQNGNSKMNGQPGRVQEEIVFVPTPVDENLYENMTKSGKHKIISNDFMLKQLNLQGSAKSVAIPSEDFSEEVLHNFGKYQKIVDESKDNDDLAKKMIKLQEADYDAYFKKLNEIEYKKVFESINQKDMNPIYDQMIQAENNIDYSEFLNKNNTNIYEQMKDKLPELYNQNAQENPANYTSIFEKYSQDNSNSGINLQMEKQMQLSPFLKMYDHKLTDQQFANEFNNIYYGKQTQNENLTSSTLTKLEPSNSQNESTSIKNVSNDSQKIRFVEKGDFIQILSNLPSDEETEVTQLINKIKEEVTNQKEKVRTELIKCQANCNPTCERMETLKKEKTEVCIPKCKLACANNSLNKLLSK